MALTKTKTSEVISKYQASPKDVGSSSVQIALITERIKYLTEHMKTHKRDYHSQLGLLKLVGQRKRLLAYVKKTHSAEYSKLIKALDLRK